MRTIQDIVLNFDSLVGVEVETKGRVFSVRKMKTMFFVDLVYQKEKIQLIFIDRTTFEINAGDLVQVRGVCIFSKRNEKSIEVSTYKLLSKWNYKQNFQTISTQDVDEYTNAFSLETFRRNEVAFLLRKYTRLFFESKNFLEVQTPFLCKKYNGGKSFPVTSNYLHNTIGYNRTTMEERMQLLVGIGFEDIFQIGSVVRSEKEITFLEGYSPYYNLEEGEKLIISLCRYLAVEMKKRGEVSLVEYDTFLENSDWDRKSYYQVVCDFFGSEIGGKINNPRELISYVINNERINDEGSILSNETLADMLVESVVQAISKPLIIYNFPCWSSPLYSRNKVDGNYIERSKMYLPGQTAGFDVGVQENDFSDYSERVLIQKRNWSLPEDDPRMNESELDKIIACGMPAMFGFGLNLDRLGKLWVDNASIDSLRVF